jgi:NAD(P)-dependent dehydrogenase (short-subunit alcohol dehydrogenase family)
MVARFEGSVAIIMGAGSGLGKANATLPAADGATWIASTCVKKGDGQLPLRSLDRTEAGSATCGISDPTAVRGLFADVVQGLGRPTILCNIAAVQQWTHSTEMAYEDWSRIVGVNLTGTFLMCQATLPHLMDGGGSIVNVGSTAGLSGMLYDARPTPRPRQGSSC